MRRSFRDRFFTPPVARAITSPLGILLAGAGAAAGIVVGLPVAGVVGIGAAAWAARVAAAVPRDPKPDRIDPFTLGEPWRRFVQDAVAAQTRFADAVRAAPRGPMRERVQEIGDRVGTAVRECWRVAQHGQALADARAHVDTTQAQRDLAEMEATAPSGPWGRGEAHDDTVEALRAQVQAGERLDTVIRSTRDRLRLLDARLEEAVARAHELSVQADDVSDLVGLGDDVDALVDELESLRQGLDEADHASDAA